MDPNGVRGGRIQSVSQFLVDFRLDGDATESITVRFRNEQDAADLCIEALEDPNLRLEKLETTGWLTEVTITPIQAHVGKEEE